MDFRLTRTVLAYLAANSGVVPRDLPDRVGNAATNQGR
jgi:hypothetical protein